MRKSFARVTGTKQRKEDLICLCGFENAHHVMEHEYEICMARLFW